MHGWRGNPASDGAAYRRASPPTLAPAPPRPPVAAQPSTTVRTGARAAPTTTASARLRILETGFSLLSALGKEQAGYGLYSYAILPSDSARAAAFLRQVFKEIPSIDTTAAEPAQVNILYVPARVEKARDFAALAQTAPAGKIGAEYAKSFYDYRMARALLNHICNPPAGTVRALCEGDMSRGPYIFTYAAPASRMESVPPPFLLVDLSDVHEQAFAELLAAFKAQVKRDDVSDQARIKTLRLTILQIALTAADWVSPVQKALADIVHSTASGDDE